ncbi:hypothetical protein GCM10029976_017120 [Kribbella albertanoniae]
MAWRQEVFLDRDIALAITAVQGDEGGAGGAEQDQDDRQGGQCRTALPAVREAVRTTARRPVPRALGAGVRVEDERLTRLP